MTAAPKARSAPTRRAWRLALAVFAIALVALAFKGWHDTMADPVVRRTLVRSAQLPLGSAPLRLALISDIHVAGPDMPPRRVARIVAQINRLGPDVVLIAGDFVSEKRTATRFYPAAQAIAPLGGLRARLGVIAVPGNHDHWSDMPAIAAELRRRGVTLLANQAIQAGPLVIGGLDDDYTLRANLPRTLAAMARLRGPRLVLSHSPDPFAQLPASVPLMLAGHTHCGQIAYPWGGAPAHLSRYGDRFGCGRIDEGSKTLIVGAGLGTSLVPLRLFTRPEIWLIELRPA